MKLKLALLALVGVAAGLLVRTGDIILTSTTTHRFQFCYMMMIPNAEGTGVGSVIIVHRRFDTSDRDVGEPPKVVVTETKLTPEMVAAFPNSPIKTNMLALLDGLNQVPPMVAYAITNLEFQGMMNYARTNVAGQ